MQSLSYLSFQNIEKENISALVFPSEEVLEDKGQIASRARNLENALKLGNLEKHKVSIDFKDTSSIKRVQTTIWSLTEYFVILKSNVRIPLNRILDVKII